VGDVAQWVESMISVRRPLHGFDLIPGSDEKFLSEQPQKLQKKGQMFGGLV
jgi:hypothetical protein